MLKRTCNSDGFCSRITELKYQIVMGILALGKMALGKMALGKMALGKMALGKMALGIMALGIMALGKMALGIRSCNSWVLKNLDYLEKKHLGGKYLHT